MTIKEKILEKLNENVKTGNEGYGYHGQMYLKSMRDNKDKNANHSDAAHKEYKKFHAQVKKVTGADDTKAKHFLDSAHGRQIHGFENDHEHIKRSYKAFNQKYNPKDFE